MPVRLARSPQLPSGLDYYEGSAGKLKSEEGGFIVVNYQAV